MRDSSWGISFLLCCALSAVGLFRCNLSYNIENVGFVRTKIGVEGGGEGQEAVC